MCTTLHTKLKCLHNMIENYYQSYNSVLSYNWQIHLQPIGRLGVDISTINLEPAVSALLDCINQHYGNKYKCHLDSINYHIKQTCQNIGTIITHNNQTIKRLLIASLNTFTNYIRHLYQPDEPAPLQEEHKTFTQHQSVSSDAFMEQILNYSNITEVLSPSPLLRATTAYRGGIENLKK